MLVTSFALLYQQRIAAVLNAFAAQSIILALAVAWAAWSSNRPDLFITALIAFTLKGIVIPVALRRTVTRLGIHREVEKVVGVGAALMVGLALTGLAQALVVKVASGTASHAREELALALAIILLGFLMMIVRRNAVTQVVGFMREALLRTYNAAPEPKWVVALGDCATNCGVFAGSPAVVGPLAEILPVDLHVPGCPPRPLDIVKALLALIEAQV